MSIGETREQLISEIKTTLLAVFVDVPVTDVAVELEQVAGFFQGLAICNLLLFGDCDRFYANLARSGQTRRYFLSRCRTEGVTASYHLAISRWESFLDAVAAGQLELASEIVALSTEDLVADGEYEEDFCYVAILQRFVLSGGKADASALVPLLERFAKCLEGKESPRYNLLRALFLRDAEAYAEGFETLIGQRVLEIQRDRKTVKSAALTFEPRSRVFVEGVALLRLGHGLGFPMHKEYSICPSIALQPPTRPIPEDIYVEIDAERLRHRS